MGDLIISLFQLPGHGDSQLQVVMKCLRTKLLKPDGLIKALAGISLTITPFIFCLTRPGRTILRSADSPRGIALICLFISLAMGLVGGVDTTRIFYIGYPLFLLFFVECVKGESSLRLILLTVIGMIANRFTDVIPDSPLSLIPNNDLSGLFYFIPDHAHIVVACFTVLLWLASWFMLFGPGWQLTEKIFTPSRWRSIFESRES